MKKVVVNIFLSCIIITMCLVIYVKKFSSEFSYTDYHRVPKTTVGLILGAGIKSGKPSVYLKDRLDKGIELYKFKKIDVLLISGDNGNDKDDEITVMKNYLLLNNIPYNKILVDTAGYDTYSSMYRAKNIFHLDSVTIVTQKYHLCRAIFLGKKLGLNCYGMTADKSNYAKYTYYQVRECLSIVKSYLDIVRKRKV